MYESTVTEHTHGVCGPVCVCWLKSPQQQHTHTHSWCWLLTASQSCRQLVNTHTHTHSKVLSWIIRPEIKTHSVCVYHILKTKNHFNVWRSQNTAGLCFVPCYCTHLLYCSSVYMCVLQQYLHALHTAHIYSCFMFCYIWTSILMKRNKKHCKFYICWNSPLFLIFHPGDEFIHSSTLSHQHFLQNYIPSFSLLAGF